MIWSWVWSFTSSSVLILSEWPSFSERQYEINPSLSMTARHSIIYKRTYCSHALRAWGDIYPTWLQSSSSPPTLPPLLLFCLSLCIRCPTIWTGWCGTWQTWKCSLAQSRGLTASSKLNLRITRGCSVSADPFFSNLHQDIVLFVFLFSSFFLWVTNFAPWNNVMEPCKTFIKVTKKELFSFQQGLHMD